MCCLLCWASGFITCNSFAGQYYAEIAQNQRIRLLPIPAPRGNIFANDGKTALANSSPIYNVILSREDLRDRKLMSLVQPLAEALQVDADILRDRFEQIGSQPAFESILVKQDATPADIAWVESHELEFPELRVEQQPQRRYPANGMLAHVLGYVGEISPEQLKQPSYKDKGLKPGDVIGLSGLEQTYDDYLRGKEGYRKVIVDSRGRIQDEIETVAPQAGQDLVTTIDLDLQIAAEEQLRNSATGRGVLVALNPNNGEVLALASAPTFDPNLFSRIGTKEGRAQYVAVLNRPGKTVDQSGRAEPLPARLDVEDSHGHIWSGARCDNPRPFRSRLWWRDHGGKQVYALHGKSRHARRQSSNYAFL